MGKRDFQIWLSKFRYSIADFGYYIDFNKVYKNTDSIKVELNILNSLIGSKNIEADFEKLVSKYPEILKCIPILLAVREYEIYAGENGNVKLFTFDKQINTISDYKLFMQRTGLFDLLSNHIINNLYDYVTGVETGLDSNGRKNRGGHQMEDLVENYIKKGWTQYELEGLFNIEMTKGKTILPIWHNITKQQVMDFSATLAGRKALTTAIMTANEIADTFVKLINSRSDDKADN